MTIEAEPGHCLITGASSGIGAALACQLAGQGWQVTALARRADRLADLATRQPGLFPLTADVTEEKGLAKALAEARKARGPLQLAILNAGMYQPHYGLDLDRASFRRHMEVNYFGVLNCLAEILPEMQQQDSGHIAIMASVAGWRGLPRSAAYGPTKAALINLAESLRFDLVGTSVKLQLINPGFVETEATAVNDFAMPGLVSAEQAAKEIIAGLASESFAINFPKSFVRRMRWLQLMPDRLYFSLTRKATGR